MEILRFAGFGLKNGIRIMFSKHIKSADNMFLSVVVLMHFVVAAGLLLSSGSFAAILWIFAGIMWTVNLGTAPRNVHLFKDK